jgi:hypothetical protein
MIPGAVPALDVLGRQPHRHSWAAIASPAFEMQQSPR